LGRLTKLEETPAGLIVEGSLDLDNPVARSAHAGMLDGRLSGVSVGVSVRRSHREGDVTVFDDVDLIEVSLTPVPANAEAAVLAVKSTTEVGRAMVASMEADLIRGELADILTPSPPRPVMAGGGGVRTVQPERITDAEQREHDRLQLERLNAEREALARLRTLERR
jgi:hypothetical protein